MPESIAYILYGLFAVGGIALYLAMPRPEGGYGKSGALIGLAAIVGLVVLIASSFEVIEPGRELFYILGAVAIFCAGRVVTHPRPVYSVVYFMAVVFCVAVLLVLQQAEFLAVALVLIYAGAILVTYAFVLMLAQQALGALADIKAREPLLAILVSFVAMGAIAGRVSELLAAPPPVEHQSMLAADKTAELDAPPPAQDREEASDTLRLGEQLFGKFVVTVELAGVLLLVAMVGAIAIARKQVPVEHVGPPPPPPGRIGREVPPF